MDTNRRYGLCQHRLESNPLEKRFSDEWHKYEGYGDWQYGDRTLSYLLSPYDDKSPIFVEEETKHIAATIIQWLGSPIGQGFLREVMEGEEWR